MADDPYSTFEGNLDSLRLRDRELAERIAAVRPHFSAPVRYRFLEARNGDPVPALVGAAFTGAAGTRPGVGSGTGGTGRPLHSLMDPRREGARLISTLQGEDFLIFLGLGGGYQVEAALERPETDRVIIVEFGLRGFAELLGLRDLRGIIADRRVRLLVDPRPGVLEGLIPDCYLPVLSGAIRTLPLRSRVEADRGEFAAAAEELRRAIDRVSADYSVQAHFGIRMFANILRNLGMAEETPPPLPRIDRAAVCAAGPSLDTQLPRIAEARGKPGRPFLIATDTSLPALLSAGVEPDGIISIDCQHISYRHFIPPPRSFPMPGGMGGLIPPHIPLFLDLASPVPLASLGGRRIFFSGGHPLTVYIASRWRPLPALDSSGGNVTHAAVSLAELLGAREIELYGADFSYPLGRTYARGTYIFPYFDIRQNRLNPLEALFSQFLYRSPLEKRDLPGKTPERHWYYETETLVRYRESLEAKGEGMGARLLPARGLGAPITVRQNRRGKGPPPPETGRAALSAREFLGGYREQIRALPPMPAGTSAGGCLAALGDEGRQILATLLPLAAALRRKEPDVRGGELIERTKDYAIAAVDRALGGSF
jgi:hypothetical protein